VDDVRYAAALAALDAGTPGPRPRARPVRARPLTPPQCTPPGRRPRTASCISSTCALPGPRAYILADGPQD
jgi:hypothetical protein